jgi:hypothetical protein
MAETERGKPDALTGWREIAAYLGRSVRTARRWELELDLPIHRAPTPDGGQMVSATRQEIDAWRARQTTSALAPRGEGENEDDPAEDQPDQPNQPDDTPGGAADGTLIPASASASDSAPAPTATRPKTGYRRVAIALCLTLAIGIGVGAAVAVRFMPATRGATRFEVQGTVIRALTSTDETVWTWPLGTFARNPETTAFSRPTEHGDLDGDGSPEVVVPVTFARPEVVPSVSDAVFLFDHDGRLRWKVQPTLRFGDGDETFAGPWRVRDVLFTLTSPRRLWIAYSQDEPSRPGFVLEVAADGQQVVRYLQSSRISTIAHWLTASGDYLAVAGTDTATLRPSVAVISRQGPAAVWPAREEAAALGHAPRCDGCPREPPDAVFLFPFSEVNRVLRRPFGFVYRLLAIGQDIRLETDDGARGGLMAWIGGDLHVAAAERPARYWAAHRGLEAEGRIDHRVEDCPDRHDPVTIRAWHRGAGWTDEAVRLR